MPFFYNGTRPATITYNGNDVKKVIYNGVTVWEKNVTFNCRVISDNNQKIAIYASSDATSPVVNRPAGGNQTPMILLNQTATNGKLPVLYPQQFQSHQGSTWAVGWIPSTASINIRHIDSTISTSDKIFVPTGSWSTYWSIYSTTNTSSSYLVRTFQPTSPIFKYISGPTGDFYYVVGYDYGKGNGRYEGYLRASNYLHLLDLSTFNISGLVG